MSNIEVIPPEELTLDACTVSKTPEPTPKQAVQVNAGKAPLPLWEWQRFVWKVYRRDSA